MVDNITITPLDWRTPIVNPDGTPSLQFIRLWQQLFGKTDTAFVRASLAIDFNSEAERIRDVIGDTLVAGPNIIITVDDDSDTITIESTGGGGSVDSLYIPLVDGAEPPTLISDGAGLLVMIPWSP